MTIYVDVLIVNNMIMTLAIIWAVGQILAYPTSWPRLLGASLVGTIYSLLMIILAQYRLAGMFKIPLYIGLNLVVVYLMARLAFGGGSTKKTVKSIFWIYGLTFLVIGLLFFFDNLLETGFQLTQYSPLVIALAGAFLLILIGKLCWRFFQTRPVPEEFILPLKIRLRGKRVKIHGLLDTGNRLQDPLSGQPVLIVELRAAVSLFPENTAKELTASSEQLNQKMPEILKNTNLRNNVRLVPFSDLGEEHGILPGIIPDRIIVEYEGRELISKEVVLGFTNRRLDDRNSYQALLPPEIIKE